MELIVDNIPLLVNGFSLMATLNRRVSAFTFHKITIACSSGSFQTSSLYLTPFSLKVSVIECGTSLLLLINFVKLNPPSLHIDLTSLISLIASFSGLTDFNRSSARKFSSVCVHFQFHISSHFPLQFFPVHSCFKPQKKHHQKHEHTSCGWLGLLRNYHTSTVKVSKNFGIFLTHVFENRFFLCQP